MYAWHAETYVIYKGIRSLAQKIKKCGNEMFTINKNVAIYNVM